MLTSLFPSHTICDLTVTAPHSLTLKMGALAGTRTQTPPVANRLLYPLSYQGTR